MQIKRFPYSNRTLASKVTLSSPFFFSRLFSMFQHRNQRLLRSSHSGVTCHSTSGAKQRALFRTRHIGYREATDATNYSELDCSYRRMPLSSVAMIVLPTFFLTRREGGIDGLFG